MLPASAAGKNGVRAAFLGFVRRDCNWCALYLQVLFRSFFYRMGAAHSAVGSGFILSPGKAGLPPPNCLRFPDMLRLHLAIWLGGLLLAGTSAAEQKDNPMKFGMVIHGGAGTIERREMTPENEAAHRAGLEQSLKAGYDILQRGGSSLDAVEAAIRVLEDNPLFNAGKGAVFTHEGTNELDASIMDGKTLNAGAFVDLQHIRNPISLARMGMERSPHVMLVGAGRFARKMGIPFVNQKYFYTDER